MRILALECSTREHSAALLDEHRCLAETVWQAGAGGSAGLFAALAGLLADSRVPARDVDAYTVGLGPGSFTGIRSAVATMRAMALPDQRTVVGVSSAQALACDLLRRRDAPDGSRVAVVGDARRGSVWIAVYVVEGRCPVPEGEIRLVTMDGLADTLPCGALVVTPDVERIGIPVEAAAKGASASFDHDTPPPRAAVIGAIAARLPAQGRPIPPPVPLYLHAAVAK